MTQYGSPDGDNTVPIVLALVIAILIVIGLLFAFNKQPIKVEVKANEQAQEVKKEEPAKEEVKPVEEQKSETKEDCTFYRTMYYANFGKPMSNYYFIQWQGCEGRNQ